MRTVFVNPARRKRARALRIPVRVETPQPRRRRPRKAGPSLRTQNARLRRKVATMQLAPNPRRRRRRATTRRRPTTRRRRRRNAGITPFVANPLILQNPGRRRRRRNPAMRLNLRTMANDLLMFGSGSALGVGLNVLGINQVQNQWARNGLRIGAAVLLGGLLKGRGYDKVGASAAGAVMYPLWQEVATTFLAAGVGAGATEADLLSADLEGVLDEAGSYMDSPGGVYVP